MERYVDEKILSINFDGNCAVINYELPVLLKRKFCNFCFTKDYLSETPFNGSQEQLEKIATLIAYDISDARIRYKVFSESPQYLENIYEEAKLENYVLDLKKLTKEKDDPDLDNLE